MDIYTKYKRPKKEPEINSGELVTEQAGYIPAQVQIQAFIAAGARLNEYRKEYYDFGPDDSDDIDLDVPVRSPGVDLAEVHEISQAVNSRLYVAKKEADKKSAEDAKAAEEARILQLAEEIQQKKVANPEKQD